MKRQHVYLLAGIACLATSFCFFVHAYIVKPLAARSAQTTTAAFARPRGKRPPFYVVIDEFARFVIKDICAILDGGRKFGLHLILAHQHLRQLREQDPEVYFSTMTNARLKSVFGGLNVEDVETMAKELFLKELNPDEVKDEIWQTKLMPQETTRTVRSDSWSEGTGESVGEITHMSLATGEMFIPGSGLWSGPELKGTSNMSGSGGSSGGGRSSSSSYGATATEVPFYEYHEYKELSSRTFRSLEEQLWQKQVSLQSQPNQFHAVLYPGELVQFYKTGTLKDFGREVKQHHVEELKDEAFTRAGCFSDPENAQRQIDELEEQLLRDANPTIEVHSEAPEVTKPEAAAPAKKSSKRPKPKPNFLSNIDPDAITGE